MELKVNMKALAELITANTRGIAEVRNVWQNMGAGIKWDTIVITYPYRQGTSSYQALYPNQHSKLNGEGFTIAEATEFVEQVEKFIEELNR